MSDKARPQRSRNERGSVFAGVVAAFATAVERLRGGHHEMEFTEEVSLWDDEGDGGLAASRVPRVPPDRSGSGSAAMKEPTDPSVIRER